MLINGASISAAHTRHHRELDTPRADWSGSIPVVRLFFFKNEGPLNGKIGHCGHALGDDKGDGVFKHAF